MTSITQLYCINHFLSLSGRPRGIDSINPSFHPYLSFLWRLYRSDNFQNSASVFHRLIQKSWHTRLSVSVSLRSDVRIRFRGAIDADDAELYIPITILWGSLKKKLVALRLVGYVHLGSIFRALNSNKWCVTDIPSSVQ